jgi:hypothetical protein
MPMKNNQRQIVTPAVLKAALAGDFENAAVAMIPGGIEAQEAAGQVTFCASAILPKDCPRDKLEALGVKFGKDHDDIFVCVILPAGWKKQATDHSMHSDLLDGKGRKRGSIFYKAAFYDRSARMHLVPRYSVDSFIRCDSQGNVQPDVDYSTRPTHFLVAVKNGKEIIHSLGVTDAENGYDSREQLEKNGYKWLGEHYPQWQDPLAYWD